MGQLAKFYTNIVDGSIFPCSDVTWNTQWASTFKNEVSIAKILVVQNYFQFNHWGCCLACSVCNGSWDELGSFVSSFWSHHVRHEFYPEPRRILCYRGTCAFCIF